MAFSFSAFKRRFFRLDVQSWKDLLRDRERPWRTAIGAGIGAFIGGMPLLGVHTWVAAGVGAVAPVPPLAVIAGSNVSNPLTIVPITFVEIRVGQLLLGRAQDFVYEGFSIQQLGQYWFEAWVGFIVVGPVMGVLTTLILRVTLARSPRDRGSSPAVDERN